MSSGESQWSQQPHLLPPLHTNASFPSPSTPSSSISEQHYPPYYAQSSQSPLNESSMVDQRQSTSLSLNLSGLSVTSPTNLSPIHPSVSPITPISPSNAGLHQNALTAHHSLHHTHVQPPFQFAPPEQGVRYDESQYNDYPGGRRITSSRSSSSSEKSVPRKRSFTSGNALSPPAEESAATPVSGTYDHSSGAAPMDTSPYDEVDMNYGGLDAENSPIDGSTSGGEQDEQGKASDTQGNAGQSTSQSAGSSAPVPKPLGTNNFVTKLYQMINDPKSAQFISWTELGTSFVVSNVGEFSRTILGSHFKHNNFSSFVRQLNMYGFHKINRTPRAQRTSADVQTWEFSHHKFLRGRPDLLEEIKRKALEPDPSLKQRVELPGEVAAQLSQMRDDNRRLAQALSVERQRADRLTNVTKILYDVMVKAFPGHVPVAFPTDLLDANDSPNIMITSPTSTGLHSHFAPSLSSLSNNPSLHSLHSLSPGSSPTAPEFPSHSHTPHNLSRQHSFQHVPDYGGASIHGHHGMSGSRYDSAMATPLPPSPGPMDVFEDAQGRKRQRTNPEDGSGGKKGSRARSDSAPLGYQLTSGWQQGRPRSGSGLQSNRVSSSRREELPVPNIGSLSRGHPLPMLSIPVGKQSQPSS
ncbi:HSF-type DNA-binding-domain-containing protein [Phanerochaete sordida]|uniref:HSF-type DNA-binding-domain-containing protein n=1 Tax=Phanerochaete sordida TaxID=48140 RepID=A0A9P3GGF3_9APHY|nr:HSF-type DNA-binding-domain-containing protein [Phanerochaete sordida]